MRTARVVAALLAPAAVVATVGTSTAVAQETGSPPEAVAEVRQTDWPEYARGDVDVDVFAAEHVLDHLGYAPGTVDLTFDGATEDSVARFQADQGIDEGGALGQGTWDAMSAATFDGRVWGPGDSGPMVVMIQRLLNAKYQAHIAEDGEYDRETADAVAWVQEFHGLEPDGLFGPITFRAVITHQDYDT